MNRHVLEIPSKLLCHLILLLCLRCFQYVPLSEAQVAAVNPYLPGNPYCSVYSRDCAARSSKNESVPSSVYGSLPQGEVVALKSVISALGPKIMPEISTSSCGDGFGDLSIYCTDCTNNQTCHIKSIYLYGRDLEGTIDEAVGDLLYLETLDLSNNKLTGTISSTLGKLQSLQLLDLGDNLLEGNIPNNFWNLTALTTLDLENNFLNGSIPSFLGSLLSLQYLSLSQNLFSGPIPNDLGKLSNLTFLNLEENQLNGSLPEIGNLTSLSTFWVGANNLTGKIPDSYANLTQMYSFKVFGNSLSGKIPDFFANWTYLSELYLLGNNFEGKLDAKIFNMTSIRYLLVSDLNTSDFDLPSSANISNIYYLTMRNCSITGQIPTWMGNLSNLAYLFVEFCHFSDLSYNKLTGSIPDSFSHLSLTNLHLTSNMLHGAIPSWIQKSVQTTANLFNCCSIAIPNTNSTSEINKRSCAGDKSKYHSLFINCGGEEMPMNGVLYAQDNASTNYFVSQDGHWGYTFSGDYLATTTSSADLIRNMTCGISVPDAPLYTTARLAPLSLTYYGFCMHKGTYKVNLHFAEIVYSEKEDHSSIPKRVFDVYIQGNRVLKDFNIKEDAGGSNKISIQNFSAEVTDHLLTIHLFWAGKGSFINKFGLCGPLISAISVTPDFPVGKSQLSALHIGLIVAASVIFPLLLLLFLWRIGCLQRRNMHDDDICLKLKDKDVTVREIKEATQNFSKEVIGEGGSGIVFKACLHEQNIAVKKLFAQSVQGISEFDNEVNALKKFEHENLVPLLGSYRRNDLYLLIYQHMEHNSLARALFDPNVPLELNWKVRYGICLGIAKGLEYLHQVKVFHRDIKATNILLDETLQARISDFGLAKLHNEENQHMVTRKVAGTYGYMAPEYAMRGLLSEKTDVYSYGVVILEIVSGKNNAEHNKDYVFLLDKVRLAELVDERLRYEVDFKEEEAVRILTLSVMCTSPSPSLRPEMSKVVSVLQGNLTIEQLFAARPMISVDSKDKAMSPGDFQTYTDFSSTSTEVTSTSSTSNMGIKAR
ncbi:Malectin domain [Dillenia turbinata]|uniref:non-specific serine/threonine protein kinase n=1 Tax=Dillenia turbinata TaxID=194707 RepID=A0AAN8YYJ2_9MAGN